VASELDTSAVAPAVIWDDSTGNPSPGCLRLEIPFTGPDQHSRVSVTLETPTDYSSMGMTANLRLVSTLATAPPSGDAGAAGAAGSTGDPIAVVPGTAKLFVRTGTELVMADSGEQSLDETIGWITLRFRFVDPVNVEDEAAYDPTQVREIGVEIDNGPNGASGTALLHLDTVQR
jgi:hypothetical protein